MTITLINCVSRNNGQDGIYLGPGVKAELINCKTNDNGRNGVTVHENSDVTFNGHEASGNTEHGIFVVTNDLLRSVGLNEDTDKEKLKELLMELKATPAPNRTQIVQTSFLNTSLALLADSTTVIANILDLVDKLPPM